MAEGASADLPDLYQLAFEEAGRSLDIQERTVNELRGRAGVLMAATAITTSFFGARAVTGTELTKWGWIAIVAFVLVGISVLSILWPRRDWSFSASAIDIIADYVEPEPVDLPKVHRDLAIHRSTAYDQNARQLGKLFWGFRIGLVALVAEVGAWFAVLVERA